MRINLLVCLILLWMSPVTSQQLASAITQQYQPAVIIKVQEVSRLLNLPENRQLTMARHFYLADSLISNVIISGRDDNEIQKMKDSMQAVFRLLLTSPERDLYYTHTISAAAAKEARLTSAYLVKKYKAKPAMEPQLFALLFRQQIDFQKLFLLHAGTSQLDTILFKNIADNQAAIENYMDDIKAQQFLQEELTALQAISPVSKKDQDRITAEFMSLEMQKKQLGNRELFYNALRKVIRDTIYYGAIFRDEIQLRAAINGGYAAHRLAIGNQLTKAGYDAIYAQVMQKEKALATYDYTFPVFTRYKDSLITGAARYYDSLITIALMKDGSFPFVSLFTTTIKMRDKLQLSSEQVDSVMSGAFTLQKLYDAYKQQHPGGKFDAAPFEADKLPHLLTEDQYMMLLGEKNRTRAEEWANKDWKEMRRLGMAAASDSLSVIWQLTEYNKKRLAAKDRYANDDLQQTAYINDIDATMPELLRRLKVARKKTTVATLPAQDGAKNTYQW